jgi:hypothetical protein
LKIESVSTYNPSDDSYDDTYTTDNGLASPLSPGKKLSWTIHRAGGGSGGGTNSWAHWADANPTEPTIGDGLQNGAGDGGNIGWTNQIARPTPTKNPTQPRIEGTGQKDYSVSEILPDGRRNPDLDRLHSASNTGMDGTGLLDLLAFAGGVRAAFALGRIAVRAVISAAAKVLAKDAATVAAKGVTNALKFGGDEAVIHFGKHADQIMKVTGKSAYNLKNYVDDANWIIQNGTYSSKLNGYYSFMANGSKGQSLFGFVGMKNGGSTISTFHIKSAAQLGLK